ncbi:hypothetical protein VTK26DRAFT_3128 [Humicola hyalothermophila]
MGHAWLDSLSEDWVSQPGSDASAAPSPDPKTAKPRTPGRVSRIPRPTPHPKKIRNAITVDATSNGSSSILGERSINERLAQTSSRRTPSKLSQEVGGGNSGRDCHACRNASVSTTTSVVRHTIHRKSVGASPAKGKGETPEWKRRLVYGDLSYGEQRDLFTSAGTGLENIFKPPAPPSRPATDSAAVEENNKKEDLQVGDVTLPSSPPFHSRDPSTVEIHVDGEDESAHEPSQQLPRRRPAAVRYKRTEESPDASRLSELSVPPDNHSQTGGGSIIQKIPMSADQSAAGLRKVSNWSDLRHEDFSPILLERRQASNGKTIFGPADLPPDELRKRLETLRQNQMILTGDANEDSLGAPSPNPVQPGAATETTEEYEKRGGFVNFQRGGRSDEGSFRNHMLSSALNDTSELHPEESLQASTPKQFPTVRVERWATAEHTPSASPDLPRAPDPSPEKRLAVPPPRNPGSPLKLFQPYDTFTSQTLLRRLSQVHDEPGEGSFSIAEVDTPSQLLPPAVRGRRQFSPSANRFGAGELDGYEFNDEFSHLSHDASGLEGDKENRGPEGYSMSPSHVPIFDWTKTSSPFEAPDLLVSRRRQKSTSRRSGRASLPAYGDLLSTRRRRVTSGSEIKRPRTSPSKDPTPKRRRTLHKSDVSYGMDDDGLTDDSVQLSHKQVQPAFGRSRQEMPGSDRDEGVEAQDDRPWTPTPHQRLSVQRERQPFAEIERSPARSSRISQPPAALPVGAKPETSRKPSIKTEDFINEANKIMAMIRNKAGLASGLASVEESDEEKDQQSPELEDSYQESTQERFSRPPSREGRPPLTRVSTKQEDPALVEQLKKYEEASDMGDIITSSMRSAALRQGAISAAQGQETASQGSHRSVGSQPWPSDDGVLSDPPNMRISQNPDWHEHQPASGQNDGVPSRASTGPPTQATGMSIQTASSRNSSRGSEARKTIAPESVSHLIPDQVGNMVLDRERNVWVKRKSLNAPEEARSSFIQSEASEEDPFAGIPDLSVDITTEMQNLMLTGKKELAPQEGLPNVGADWAESPTRKPQNHNPKASVSRRLEEAVEHEIRVNESRVKEPRRLTISFSSPVASVIQSHAAPDSDVTSDGASILEQAAADGLPADAPMKGRRSVSIQGTTRSTGSLNASRGPPRHLSIRGQSLMARPVSRIDERDEEFAAEQAQHQEAASGMELSLLGDHGVVSREAETGPPANPSFLVATPTRSRECPVAGIDAAPVISQYVGRFSLSPLSDFTLRHREETLPLEVSYVVDNHRLATGDGSKRVMSMSVRELVSKLAEVEPFEPYWGDMRELVLRGKGLGSLHALDQFCGRLESLDVSKNSVRNLGGIPSSVRHLRVMDNELSSLTAWNHLMNLQYVDVSNNGITSLSAFASLVHLRSLRADNNQITSLDGIKFHKGLQTLRARGNAIEVVDFDGATMHQLTDLDLKNNRITSVAHIAQLPVLHSLNLENNRLESFAVDPLPSGSSSTSSSSQLRYLRLDDNRLSLLSVRGLPHLRLLHADRNRLVRLDGLSSSRCGRRIDSLSLREQGGAEPLDVGHLLARAYEVRKLYLSGNYLGGRTSHGTVTTATAAGATSDKGQKEKEKEKGRRDTKKGGFHPPVDLLNLQLLELANCGLRDADLPPTLGLMMPNLRVVNANMNALTEDGVARMLRGVPRLKRVLLAGNRVGDLGRVVDLLGDDGVGAGAGACLTVLDLRDCPVTGGFYAPVALQVRRQGRDGNGDGPVEGEAGNEGDDEYGYGYERGGGAGSAGQSQHASPFALPDQDPERDAAFCGRLDMDTRVRRRLYEVLLARGCRRLRTLDGLPVRGRAPSGKKGRGGEEDGGGDGVRGAEEGEEEGGEDMVLAEMRERGLVRSVERKKKAGGSGKPEAKAGGEVVCVESETQKAGRSGGRWPAEDSFA